MTENDRTITKLTEPGHLPTFVKSRMTSEQLRCDYQYCLAQKMLKTLLQEGLISMCEFDKITEKNQQTFSPYLSEIMH